MARSNLHELATKLLHALNDAAADGIFEGKLRTVAAEAGLNSVRSAEVVRLLESLGRIEVVQRGRRGRDTVVRIQSTDGISPDEARSASPERSARRGGRLHYDEIGKAVVDRLLELARDDGLRAAQVEAFAAESGTLRSRVGELEVALDDAAARETQLRIELKAAQETLARAEENLQKIFSARSHGEEAPVAGDDETQAVLDILRSGLG